ncbi:Tat pathway signal protein [Streptomyces scopuliridis]|uniref:Tat pathway signal protein n=1 Tax=Streptomyces scopuliridis TaxID=452529 RepID=A0ACD4ZT81_9ACTN|nr:Tat pathway signal protein [Streptomyces scopuliridis]WSC01718.1 Tat pathway signal protein [Streptomyces scopuliridis]WSC04743.1 Tat pathway signal protein [Streptomyces scopuliridis]
MARSRNTELASAIRETGWSQQQTAARFAEVAAENGASELLGITRSHISQWVLGTQPSGRAPHILCETLSRELRRPITPAAIGLRPESAGTNVVPEWSVDTLNELADLGRTEMERRHALTGAAYSVVGLALPGASWWDAAPERARSRKPVSQRSIGQTEVESVREMAAFFSRRDQRRGGGDGRAALVAYLRTDVAEYLNGHFPSEETRCALYTAAGELSYLSGWMAFDASQHSAAQRYFTLAIRLAAEAGNAPLEGHILRAMAHQANDLGHSAEALKLATASLERKRYSRASARERALLGVVHARTLAATKQRKDAMSALRRAESDLAAADTPADEPGRVMFFTEASLAHETACTLRDLGDLSGAQNEFIRSVRTRNAQLATRTHSVTLGYLGAVQAQQGSIEAACATWSRALDAMDGVQSGRARDTVVQMRRVLSPFRGRNITAVTELDTRARTVLSRIV